MTTNNDRVALTTEPEMVPPATPAAAVSVVESSEQDDRLYATKTLPNGLEVLLISDPTTDKASAALDVKVGHLSDPECAPGLAHFCEHMLFLGTEKYPNENEYHSYLNAHGGNRNAFTDTENTNYYFDVASESFEGALDRFAQFFISPLFTASATEREMNAVDSEHNKNLQNDMWRTFQLTKSLCRKDHPFRKFGSGNMKTLRDDPKEAGVDIRVELLKFHDRYYSANVMKLVVLGKETLEELENLVIKYFADVPNKNIAAPKFPGTPFGPAQLAKRINVVPVKETRSVQLTFPLREIQSLYLKKPTKYLSHLIGHEGKGSILALLREKGWANNLTAGQGRSCSDWSSFAVTIDLTDEGLERVNDVVEIVFAYISLLKDAGLQRWVYDETATVAAMTFRFLSKMKPINYTCYLAVVMHLYPGRHFLSGPYKLFEYGPESIEECMSYLTPSNMLLFVAGRKFKGSTSSKEEWYGTDYSVDDIGPDLLDKWSKASVDSDLVSGMLSFPERNDMIASDFTLREVPGAPKDEPRLLMDSTTCRLWYKPDNVFSMPKVNTMALLKTSTVNESPEASVLARLWVQILDEHAKEFTYMASMANLRCAFVNARDGIEIHVSGYNHKVNVLVGRIVDAIHALADRLEVSLFERIKDKAEKQFKGFLYAQPYQHAFYAGDLVLEMSKWTIEDKMAALSAISMADMLDFSRRLLARFHLELLVHGNTSPDEAKTIANTFIEKLEPSDPFVANLPSNRVVMLEKGREYCYRFPEFNQDNKNSSLQVVYQIGPMDLPTRAILSFLHHLIKEPAFNELRTNEQLGYIVHTSIKTSGDDIKGLLFLIQSDGYHPGHLDERVEAFLDRFRSRIVDMSAEEFQKNVAAVVNNFLEKNKNIGEESSKYWTVVTNKSYIFRNNQIIGAEVAKLTVGQVLRFFDKYIAADAPLRSKMGVHVFAKNHMDKFDSAVPDGVTLITNDSINDFKRSMGLFPLPQKVDVEGMRMEA